MLYGFKLFEVWILSLFSLKRFGKSNFVLNRIGGRTQRWNSVFSPLKHRTNLFPIPLHMELQPYQPYFATYGKPVETPLQLSYESDVQFLG